MKIFDITMIPFIKLSLLFSYLSKIPQSIHQMKMLRSCDPANVYFGIPHYLLNFVEDLNHEVES